MNWNSGIQKMLLPSPSNFCVVFFEISYFSVLYEHKCSEELIDEFVSSFAVKHLYKHDQIIVISTIELSE